MNPLVGHPPLAVAVPAPEVGHSDRVLAPDGRIGEVIGVYRAEDDAVLVRFDSGDRQRYIRADLHPLD